MNSCLHGLNGTDRKLAPVLYLCQQVFSDTALAQRLRKNIRSRHCILDRKVDTNSAGWRHSMRRISDAKQAGFVPLAQTINLDREQFYLVPVFDLLHAVAEKRSNLQQRISKSGNSSVFHSIKSAFADD